MLKVKDINIIKEKYRNINAKYNEHTGRLEEIEIYGGILSRLNIFRKKKIRIVCPRGRDDYYIDDYGEHYTGDFNRTIDLDIVYDLIKNDLVEKVK